MRFVQAGTMLLGTVVYIAYVIYVFSYMGFSNGFDSLLLTIAGWNALLLIVTILVILDSIRKVSSGRSRELATGVFVVKLTAIPFFLINFALMALLALGGTVMFIRGGFVLIGLVAISAALTYLAMLSTSVYGWASIAQLRSERRFGTVKAVLYTLLLGVFVADIVIGILLFVEYRRGVRSALLPRDVARVKILMAEPGHDPATP